MATPGVTPNTDPVNLRCFVEIQNLVDSNPAAVATLGELSQLSMTYSRTLSETFSSTQPGYKVVGFNCTDTVTNTPTAVPQTITDLVVNITAQAMAYTNNHSLPYVAQNFIDTIAAATIGIATNIVIGQFVTQTGMATLPEWISLTYVPDGSQVKIWLCDLSFQEQYDLFEIIVVPPITPIDNFFQTVTSVAAELTAVTPTIYVNNIQTAKGIYPETDLQAYTFLYYPVVVGNQPIPTTWTAIIYGQAGNNLDSIKVAIQDYIATHTTHQISEWQAIFPDIYKQTEFIILPRWDLVAIPQATTITGLYAGMTDPQNDVSFAVANVPFYTGSFVALNLTVMPHYYKYITLIIVNGQNNAIGMTSIRAMFPDYISQSANNQDYNRMTQQTQAWSDMLEKMLMVAETMTDLSSLPSGMRRVYRSNILFLQTTMNNVDYLMAIKQSYSSAPPVSSGTSGTSGASV